jgi:unsaturated rhamnogalacturonyl hydrolase
MTETVLNRNADLWSIDFRNEPKWEYTYGLVMKAVLQVWEARGDERYLRFVRSYYNAMIDTAGAIRTYRPDEYNIDRINPGVPLFALYRKCGDRRYLKALRLLRSQLLTHPRTAEGGFWHKKVYPRQMWLDGLYMASPFLAEYARVFDEPGTLDDVARQFILMEKYAREEKTGLLYHGWDESRTQRWADPQTGLSPNFWGRSVGWYAMALVDALDFFPPGHPKRTGLIAIFDRLATAVTNVQDRETGLWHQILDQPTRKGNYLESSASCMFVYALAKGVRKGYLHPAFLNIARKGYRGILDRFITTDKNGLVSIHQACAVGGLGGNPYRDGSYDYYIGEKIRSNDPKAVGSFILASLEMEAAAQ